MAKAIHLKAKDAVEQLKRELALQHSESAEEVARQIKTEAEKQLNRTLANRQGVSGFFGARPKVTYRIKTTSRGSEIELKAVMADGSGNPHYVWHLLQFGIPSRVQKKTSPPIQERVVRTSVSELDVRPRNDLDRVYRIPKGTQIKKTSPRQWYEEVEKELKKFVSRKFPGWSIESSDIRKP